jgi:hypothetical protein
VTRPEAQHAWEDTFSTDALGRPSPPRFHRLVMFDVTQTPAPADAARLEWALRRLEDRHPRGPNGCSCCWGGGLDVSHATHSGLRRNQATEAEITIPAGPYAGGTTMHVSRIVLDVAAWYQEEARRAALMYAPTVTPAQAAQFSDDAPADFDRLPATARRHGVIGHA